MLLLQLVDLLIITLYYQVCIAWLFFFIFSLDEYILSFPDTQGSISSSSSLGEASNNFADHSNQPFNPSNPAIDYASSYNTDPYSAAVAAAVYSQLDGHHYGANYHSPNQSSFNNNYTGHLHGHHQNKSSSQRHNPYSRTSTNSSTSANSAGSNASNGSSSSSSATHNDNVNATAAAILSAYSSAANTANSYPAALYYPYYSAHYLHHQNVVSNYTPPSIVDINSNLTSQKWRIIFSIYIKK